uniref:Uncharacterized protein n=1 Tax=Cacopsylla melanoneura TaxID=428564 RepID=A0A8D8VDB4_9HEMI
MIKRQSCKHRFPKIHIVKAVTNAFIPSALEANAVFSIFKESRYLNLYIFYTSLEPKFSKNFPYLNKSPFQLFCDRCLHSFTFSTNVLIFCDLHSLFPVKNIILSSLCDQHLSFVYDVFYFRSKI